ncbi:MAG: glutathione peroxidase [Bacteroidia bacterium]
MKKIIPVLIIAIAAVSFKSDQQLKTLYDFKANAIDGQPFDFTSLKGKKVLIVNVASKCGLTPQYKDLQALYDKYGKDGKFMIVGFPANNFAGQEPGTNKDIETFCSKNYGVTFQMMEKISVKGDDIHPLYKWLTSKSENGVEDADVTWNFQKFMIDENGHYVGHVSPREKPDCEKIVNWLEGKK